MKEVTIKGLCLSPSHSKNPKNDNLLKIQNLWGLWKISLPLTMMRTLSITSKSETCVDEMICQIVTQTAMPLKTWRLGLHLKRKKKIIPDGSLTKKIKSKKNSLGKRKSGNCRKDKEKEDECTK